MWIVLAISGVVAVVGVFVSLRAVFPKRRGETPYCRRCGYNLTGLEIEADEARCPECGAGLREARAVLVGERRVRGRRVVLGVLLLVVGAVPLGGLGVGTLLKVDWYAYKPTSWVLADAGSDNATLAEKALAELSRRHTGGMLSAKQTARLIEVCLIEEARPTWRPGPCGRAMSVLHMLYKGDLLTEAQTERFLANLSHVTCAVRPVVVAGQEFFVGAAQKDRAQFADLSAGLDVEKIRLGQEMALPPGIEAFAGSFPFYLGRYTALSQPGSYAVAVDVTLTAMEPAADGSWGLNAPVLYRGRRTVEGVVRVLAEEPPDLFKMVHSPELDAAVAARVRVTEFAVRHHGWLRAPTLEASVYFSMPLPIGLAFDVYAGFEDRVVTLRPVASARTVTNTSSWGTNLRVDFADEPPETITITLRSSKEVALRTPDLYEIWDGELRFEDVKVLREGEEQTSGGRQEYTPQVGRR